LLLLVDAPPPVRPLRAVIARVFRYVELRSCASDAAQSINRAFPCQRRTGDRPLFPRAVHLLFVRFEGNGGLSPVLPLAQMKLDVAQNGVFGARDLVFHERAASGAGELAEHRPVVDVTAVVADVGVSRAYVRFAPHAVVLVVVAQRPQVGGALRASRTQAAAVAAHVEIFRDARDYFSVELLHHAVLPAVRLAPLGAELRGRLSIDAPVGGNDHAIEPARRLGRHRALLDHVVAYFFRIALQGIAEAACRGPDHGVDVVGLLDEVLLAERERHLLALQLRDVAGDA